MNTDSTKDIGGTQILMGLETVHKHRGYFLASGIAFLVLGTIALTYTILTTLVSVFVFGVALVFGGMFQLVHAFKTSSFKWSGIIFELFIGVLYVITGLLMAVHPLTDAQSLTLLLATLFLVVGVFRTIGAVMLRPPSWEWLLASGIVTFLFGIFVWIQWPGSALWVIGTLVSIDMIFNGVWLVMLVLNIRGLSFREIRDRATSQPSVPLEHQPT